MNIIFSIPDNEFEELAKSCFENYPEASSPSLWCTSWKYDEWLFKFEDEDGKKFTLNKEKILDGLKQFIEIKMKGGLKGILIEDYKDAGEYDAEAVDAITQLACYGEVIWG